MGAIDDMTIIGHNDPAMKVRVAKLKARLSHYLRLVRKGRTVTICVRDEPVAELRPVRRPQLEIRHPAPGAPAFWEVPPPPPLPPGLAKELLDEFLAEREEER